MYSYGTSLCLDTDLLERLGMTSLPPVGTKFTLMAKIVVTGTSSRQEQDGETDTHCDMQITDMELGAPEAEGPGAAAVLYGGS